MKKFNISVSTLESITCLAPIHSYLINLVYMSFLLAPKRTQPWSQGIQKNGNYKVTTTVTNEEFQKFQCPPGIHELSGHNSFLFDKSSVYRLSFGPKAISILITSYSENGKYRVTTTVTNKEIQHFSPPLPGIHHFPGYYSFFLTNPVRIAFLLVHKRIQSWSQEFQKSEKYRVTITEVLIQNKHLGAPLSVSTSLAAIRLDLTNPLSSTEAFNCLAAANILCARPRIALCACSLPGHTRSEVPSLCGGECAKSKVYRLSFGPKGNSILIKRI